MHLGYWRCNCFLTGVSNYLSTSWDSSIFCRKSIWTNRTRTTSSCIRSGYCNGSQSSWGTFRYTLVLFHLASVALPCPTAISSVLLLQVIQLQLPSFFDNFDPRAAAANFPSSNPPKTKSHTSTLRLFVTFLVTKCFDRCTSVSSGSHIRTCCLTL